MVLNNKEKKMRLRSKFVLTAFFFFLIFSLAWANKFKDLRLSGHFIGLYDVLTPIEAPDTLGKNRQFDAAANFDILWQIHQKVKGNIQFQMGTGFGSLGFAASGVVVTDLNVEIGLHPRFQLTVGSFDTPFGAETPYLTNNANSLGNSFYLNTLFYGAFAGTDLGTLNTIGVKGVWSGGLGELTGAITNGTDEIAFNPDGNFGFVLSGMSSPIWHSFQGGLSLIYSADSSKSGSSGSATNFSGALIDALFEIETHQFLRGYVGLLNYDDDNSSTKDDVWVWKLEGRYPLSKGYLAARVSAWLPTETGDDRAAISPKIPEAGSGWRVRQIQPLGNQKVYRSQLGFGWPVIEDMYFKAELFYDYHVQKYQNDVIDILGIIVGLNAQF
jgi:hypothetical protein